MLELQSVNAKESYTYYRYNMNEILYAGWFSKRFPGNYIVTVGRGKYANSYIPLYCGFDIETYTTETNNGFMYIWQFSIWDGKQNKIVIHGRLWEEFELLLRMLEVGLLLDQKHKLLIFIANCGYEWSFIRKHLNVTNGFFKSDRQPLKYEHNHCIEFMECLTVSGGSLKYLAANYTNTQKCVGDLDYTIPRNHKTILTAEELGYCDNDVLILAEWSQYYFNYYMRGGCGYKIMPMTIQTTLRKEMKEQAKDWYEEKGFKGSHVTRAIASCYPTEKTYNFWMKWLFRGGYVHGNIAFIGELFDWSDGIMSFDFTSSYPAVMLQCYMPSRFYHVKDVTYSEYLEYIKEYCVIATMRFKNIKATTQQSIESKSKCIELKNPLIDNGRVMEADEMVVTLTELDYRNYARFYSFDESVEIIECMIANRIMLPDYVIKPMTESYKNKCVLKNKGKNYAVEKSRTNSFYGVMVTRMNMENFIISSDSDTGIECVKGSTYEEQINKSVLLPQWGIYITAHARKRILDIAWSCCCRDGSQVCDDVLYIDTDSIKLLHGDKYMHIINQYNKRIENLNRKICKEKGLDFEIFKDLGCLDMEVSKMVNFKYLGAKRYLYSSVKKGKIVTNQTIAGLPKNTLENMFGNRKDMYHFFEDDMDVLESGKLYSYYNDEPVEEVISDLQGHTCIQKEMSNIGLAPCNFNMKLDDIWVHYYLSYQDTLKGKEVRR